MKLLVTGGAGFIGSNFIRWILNRPDVEVINLDCLTYAGNLENLVEVSRDPRYAFAKVDINDAGRVEEYLSRGVDALVNFAAESHVDRSILDASSFVRTNVQGTQVLLDAARRKKVGRYLQISTDEVYGSLGPEGRFREDTPLAPNSPYAASKAAADLLVRSYFHTYKLDVIVTRCSNNYGPYQFPEKLIPLMILNASEDRPLPVYGDGLYTRDWIHVEDHCRALELILRQGRAGQVYNIGADEERRNLEVVHRILESLGKPDTLIQHVQDRPGHDRRYAIDSSLLRRELGWRPQISFERGLEDTIRWYQRNGAWVSHVRSGSYMRYYHEMYERRGQTLANLGGD